MFNRLMSRIKNLVAIGEATGVETKVLQIKTTTGKTNDRIKRLHNYGFLSRPKVGSRAYLLFLGGTRSRGISFCVEDERHEMELAEGEVAVMDDKGNLVHFTENGITINSVGKIEITAESDVTVNTSGDVKLKNGAGVVTGDCICPYTGSNHADCSSTVFAGKK